MSFPRFKNQKTSAPSATLATFRVDETKKAERVARVAEVAEAPLENAFFDRSERVAAVAKVAATFSENAFSAQPETRAEIDLTAFHERAAIMEYDGGSLRAEAEDAAAREMGFDTAAHLHRAAIEAWRSEIEAVKPCLPDIAKLKTASLRFLASEWATQALAADWEEVALFAIHEGECPKARLDAWGLIPSLAWGVQRCTIESISREATFLRTTGGALLRQPRLRANFNEAVPWWRHPHLSHGERSCAE